MSARTMAAVLTLIASTQISMAQPFPAPGQGSRGTTQDQRDCRPDARRLCREFIGDDMAGVEDNGGPYSRPAVTRLLAK